MKHTIVSVLALILVLLAGCTSPGGGTADVGETSGANAAVNNGAAVEEVGDFDWLLHDMTDNSFSIKGHQSGTLTYTVKDAYLLDNLFDAGISIEEMNIDACVRIGKGSAQKEYAGKPDYAYVNQQTGKLVDNAYLIGIDLTITNVDASSNIYGGSGALSLSETPNPDNNKKKYLFDANALELYDSSRVGERFSIGAFAWFTGYGQQEESAWAFYLPPGETTSMTVYYLIGEYDGETLNSLELTQEPFGVDPKQPETVFPLTVRKT